MTKYHQYSVNLSKGQEKKIDNACKKGTGVIIRLTKLNLKVVISYCSHRLKLIKLKELKMEFS